MFSHANGVVGWVPSCPPTEKRTRLFSSWMKLLFCKALLRILKNYGKQFTAPLFFWCSVCLPLSAAADWSQSDIAWLRGWLSDWNDSWLGTSLGGNGIIWQLFEEDYGEGDIGVLGSIELHLQNMQMDNDSAEQWRTTFYKLITGESNTNGLVDGTTPSLYAVISNALGGGTSNPWWASNGASAFATRYAYINNALPHEYPDERDTFSFPELYSQFMTKLTAPVQGRLTPATAKQKWNGWWGVNGPPENGPGVYQWDQYSFRGTYTWFDWVADAFRSNWVLQGFVDTNALVTQAESDGVINVVDDAVSTNAVVSSTDKTNQLENAITESFSGESVSMNALDGFIDDDFANLLPSLTSGDPTLMIFEGATYGAVTVPEVVASVALPNTVVIPLHAFATALWRIMAFVALWVIAKHEWDFWSTLGGSAT